MKIRYGIDPATVLPDHEWDGTAGHDCAACPPESIWKCDEHVHDHLTDPLEKVLSSHLPVKLPNGTILCICDGELFTGPVYHRRHVVGVLRAVLEGRHDPFGPDRPHADAEMAAELGGGGDE